MSIHKIYAEFEADYPEAKNAVDDALIQVNKTLRHAGFAIANDDRAEQLVEAIARYLKACNP